MSDRSPEQEKRTATTAKGAQRRALILDAAEQILFESGYGELTMRAVAATAQTRLGHVQYYFHSRTELIAAVLRRTLDRSLDRLAPLFTDATAHTPPDTEGLVRQLLAEHDDPRLVRVYTELWALAGRDEAVATVLRTFYGDYQDHVAGFLRARDPALPDAVCQARARVFTALIEGAALFRSGIAAQRTEAADTELINTATALLG
ncbi:TetR family transcriptional regulator [Streptomyces sp. NBC_01369]|uniref:TetR/AcrR family transcriptional regulator n=1 Tax=unclassified Streptomyces TaxID=2593676 RepID=UPI00225A4488|nr:MULTISPECIES: TetR family transcriptional regulator [unclassified Streptomyces]MCX4869752.1 TetR family transcriptional regulator [Streptomyces sp. NBC_00906]MCX4900915.1 TetR family transcriptional regulator [Streptomyces sp. NBC_00892]